MEIPGPGRAQEDAEGAAEEANEDRLDQEEAQGPGPRHSHGAHDADLTRALEHRHRQAGSRLSALDALEKAVNLGFSNRELIATDADLESLREEARFQALVTPVDARSPPP